MAAISCASSSRASARPSDVRRGRRSRRGAAGPTHPGDGGARGPARSAHSPRHRVETAAREPRPPPAPEDASPKIPARGVPWRGRSGSPPAKAGGAMRRHEPTGEERALIEPRLPRTSRGVPRVDDRRALTPGEAGDAPAVAAPGPTSPLGDPHRERRRHGPGPPPTDPGRARLRPPRAGPRPRNQRRPAGRHLPRRNRGPLDPHPACRPMRPRPGPC